MDTKYFTEQDPAASVRVWLPNDQGPYRVVRKTDGVYETITEEKLPTKITIRIVDLIYRAKMQELGYG